MFDILFGWKKASKCKRLIRNIQCRLKLLKNKRNTIVKQMRHDLAELLKHGHDHIAFDRVEELYKDENLLQVYDLLETFCEFILINFPYIRRKKDFPNDINEAISSLIFASARFGDLPELIAIRKLFEERYGHRITNVALELLPGNLVNVQIQEKLRTKSVPDDVKTKLLVEIARSALKSGLLLLEYSSKLQQPGKESIVDPILSIQPGYDERGNEVQDPQAPNFTATEREVLFVDIPTGNSKKFLKDLVPSFLSSKAIFPSKYSEIVKQASVNAMESLMQKKFETLPNPILKTRTNEPTFSGLQMIDEKAPNHGSSLANKDGTAAVESSSESSAELPEETIYLDDIQEFESPVKKVGSILDQRLFTFRQSDLPLRETTDDSSDQDLEEEHDFGQEKSASRSFSKSKKVFAKRHRRRSVSIDITSIKDVECAIYYGESCDSSPYFVDEKSHDRRKNHKKISNKQLHQCHHHPQESSHHPSFVKFSSSFSFANSRKAGHKRTSSKFSSEHPCHHCTFEETKHWHCSPRLLKIECKCCYEPHSCNGKRYIHENEVMALTQTTKKYQEASRVGSQWTSKESKHAYSRAMTMLTERPNESITDNVPRSNSFPVQEPGRCSSNRHVHPKLPDYDELAAKFTALKKANLETEKQ